MSGVAIVDSAANMARDLVQREARGPGDLENAMRRIEARYGVPYATLWSLRYRKPKDIMASALLTLCTLTRPNVSDSKNASSTTSPSQKRKAGLLRLLLARLIAWLARVI